MAESQRRPLGSGSLHEVKYGETIKVIEYINKSKVLIEFQDEYKVQKWVAKSEITNGTARNPYRKTLFNRGFLGDGPFKAKENGFNTLEYTVWSGIFWRCYDERKLIRNPTYRGCYIREDWYNFQEFAVWITKQPQFLPGWDLDKDLLVKGNNCYSVDTCCLLPAEINCFFAIKNSDNGCPPGVHFATREGKYKAQIKDQYSGSNQRYLGMSVDPLEMFYVYKKAKEEQAKFLAEKWKSQLDSKAYEKLISWTIEIGEKNE